MAAPPWDPTHPDPFCQRVGWSSLDGPWDLALDPDASWERPDQVRFDRTIEVPYAPEWPASGVGHQGFVARAWYRRRVRLPEDGGRWRLRFGAVDRTATVWVDGHLAGRHVGGFTPFAVDLDLLGSSGEVEVVVRADDDPLDVTVPRGKQDWQRDPHIIWYPRTTGIWQSVWLEHRPAVSVGELRWQGDPAGLRVQLDARLEGPVPEGARLTTTLVRGDRLLGRTATTLVGTGRFETWVEQHLPVGRGSVDAPFALIWRPNHPALLDAELRLEAPDGTVLDEVRSYTALRSVAVEDGVVLLNGRPLTQRLALDQGYWPDTGMTPPSVRAMEADVALARTLGFNGVRKHQKLEDARWLAACDRAGLLVWQDLPSAFQRSPGTLGSQLSEWAEAIQRDRNHPSVVARVPVNESWSLPDVAHDPDQRAALDALAAMTRGLDGTRLVSANDGWETAGGDVVGVHDYRHDPDVLRRDWGSAAGVDALLATGRGPDGQRLDLDGRGRAGRAVLATEVGGLTMAASAEGLFSYGNTTSPDELVDRVRAICGALGDSEVLAGFCWTQLTDTFQEANGLATMDRVPKADPAALALALRGG